MAETVHCPFERLTKFSCAGPKRERGAAQEETFSLHGAEVISAPFLLLRKIRNTDGGGMDGKREMVQAFLSLHLSILFAGFTGILGKLIELSKEL